MKGKHHIILYSFLGVALVVASVLAITNGMRASASAQALESGYTQRMLEAQEHLQAIGVKLDKIPISTDRPSQCDLLTGVSRQADNVVNSLSALPLSHVAMSDTMKYGNQLSEYTLGLALSMAGGAELSSEDMAQLADMKGHCSLLLGQFVTAHNPLLDQSLKMASTQSVFYQEAELSARPLEQVAEKDTGMEYPTMIYDGAFSDARFGGTPKALGEGTIDAAQAVEIAIAYIGADRITASSQGTPIEGSIPCFGVNLTLTDGTQLAAEVTKQGGKLLWIMPEHASFTAALPLEECESLALKFLREHGYGNMAANHYQVYDGLVVINFVPVQNDVLLYPDLLKLQIRMDTGEVVGLESNNYLMNHVQREGLTPTLTPEEALAKINASVTVEGAPKLCVIPFKNEEKLCYEIAGHYESRNYLIYIDAATGEERQLMMILQNTDGVQSV
jgi:germination protein YpeB